MNGMVLLLKATLSVLSTVTILSSGFTVFLLFSLFKDRGFPPIQNIQFTVSFFMLTILMSVICFCLKNHLVIAIDSRNEVLRKIDAKVAKTRSEPT